MREGGAFGFEFVVLTFLAVGEGLKHGCMGENNDDAELIQQVIEQSIVLMNEAGKSSLLLLMIFNK